MANPWMKKNPLLSLWLSGAHAAAAPVRRPALLAVRRRQSLLAREAFAIWREAWTSPFAPKRRR